MVVERRLSYSKAREKGFSRFRAFRGAWVETKPGATNGIVTVIDEDTVQVRENFKPLLQDSLPIDGIDTYHGAAINEIPGLRWRGDPEKVEASVTRDDEVYIPEDMEKAHAQYYRGVSESMRRRYGDP